MSTVNLGLVRTMHLTLRPLGGHGTRYDRVETTLDTTSNPPTQPDLHKQHDLCLHPYGVFWHKSQPRQAHTPAHLLAEWRIAASSAQCQTYPTCPEGALGKSFQHRAHLPPRTTPARSGERIRTARLRPKRQPQRVTQQRLAHPMAPASVGCSLPLSEMIA